MPYADPAKRRAARRAWYLRGKQKRIGSVPMWAPIDMMLAVWCVWLRRRVRGLEAIWRVVVPIYLYMDEAEQHEARQLGTRIMMRLDGQDCRLSEYEGVDVLDDLLKEKAEFFWDVSYTVKRMKETRYAGS